MPVDRIKRIPSTSSLTFPARTPNAVGLCWDDTNQELVARDTANNTIKVGGGLKYAEIALTNAEIKALRATPKTLVAAPGAGYMLVLEKATLLLDYGSNALTRPNADEDMVIRYNNGAGQVISGTTTAGFITATADTVITLFPVAAAEYAKTAVENLALVLHNDGTAEFAGNAAADTLVRVKVTYRIVATGF